MSFSLLSKNTLEKFRKRERDELPDSGVQRAAYHAFEMQFWNRELNKAKMEAMKGFESSEVESELQSRVERINKTAIELLHHTLLLGDELGVTDEEWPEAPIDGKQWYRKLRLLMAHITCGDDCPVPRVCECLGNMLYHARHVLTMDGEYSLEEHIQRIDDES